MAGPSTISGAWRSDQAFNSRPGLQVTMSAERGITPQGVLTVPFRFQAPPLDRYGREWNFNFDTYTTIGDGEHARAQGLALKRPTFSSLFVDETYPWLVWDSTFDVQRLVKELRLLLEYPAGFRLVVGQPALWGPEPLLNMRAMLVNLKSEGRGGELGTEYADVEFLEWDREQLSTKARRRPAESDSERRHTVTNGETLYTIAKAVYKRASFWRTLANANGITGVAPDSAASLAKWMKDHSRASLKVPPLTGTGKVDPANPNRASGRGNA